MSKVTIYHNPRCSKSRETLELLRAKGVEPEVVLYLEQPPSEEVLTTIIQQLGMRPRELLRTNEKAYEEFGLSDDALSDQELIASMRAHPILINRPIVVTGRGTRLGRPPEVVLEIL